MFRVMLFYVLPIALTIFALVDVIQTDESDVRGIPKVWWLVLIVFTWSIGAIVWLIAGKERKPRGPRVRDNFTDPIAPDDDIEFLRLMDERRRREERKRKDGPEEQPDGDVPRR